MFEIAVHEQEGSRRSMFPSRKQPDKKHKFALRSSEGYPRDLTMSSASGTVSTSLGSPTVALGEERQPAEVTGNSRRVALAKKGATREDHAISNGSESALVRTPAS